MTEILRNARGPQSIFYPPYLLSALVITVLWLMSAQKLTARQSIALLASRSRWLTRSSRADLLLWLFNLALYVLVSPHVHHIHHSRRTG